MDRPDDTLLDVQQWGPDGKVLRNLRVSAYDFDGTPMLSIAEQASSRPERAISLPAEVWFAMLDAFVDWIEEHG